MSEVVAALAVGLCVGLAIGWDMARWWSGRRSRRQAGWPEAKTRMLARWRVPRSGTIGVDVTADGVAVYCPTCEPTRQAVKP